MLMFVTIACNTGINPEHLAFSGNNFNTHFVQGLSHFRVSTGSAGKYQCMAVPKCYCTGALESNFGALCTQDILYGFKS